MRVLLVDDTAVNRRLARALLEADGHTVLEAKDGVEALAVLRSATVDVVVSDVLMPRMDGYSLVREMRREERWRRLPVLLASAVLRERDDVGAAQALGADGFVPLPLTAEGLRASLAALPPSPQHIPPASTEDLTVLRFALDRMTRKLIASRARADEVAEMNVLLGERLQATQGELRGALEEREQRVREWLRNAVVPRLLTEGDKVLEANEAAAALFGRSPEAMAGQSLRGLLASDGPRRGELLGRLVAHPEQWPEGSVLELEFTRPDGAVFPVELSVMALSDPAGRRLGAVTLRDVSERRRAQQALLDPSGEITRFIEGAQDLLLRLEPDSTIRYVSETSQAFLGFTPAELTGRVALDLVLPSDRDDAARMMAQLVHNPAHRAVGEFRMRRKDGDPLWVEWAATAVTDPEAGVVREVLAVGRDVTKRRASEEALRASEERFRLLADSLSEVFWMQEYPGRKMLYVSPAYEAIWGRPRAELERDPGSWLKAVHPEDQGSVERAFEAAGRGPVAVEYRVLRPDGSMRWVETRAQPLRDDAGAVTRLVGATIDVTARKVAEQERARAERHERELAHLREVEAFRQRFMNMAAHELGTPLTPMKLHLDLLATGKAGPLTERQGRAVSSIGRNVERLGRLVADLLDAARIQADRMRVQLAPADLGALARRAVETYGPFAAESGVRLEAAGEGDAHALADAGRIGQVLDNLLSNAVKFTPRGGVVRVTVARAGDRVRIEVADSGRGIAAEDLPRLFQPFAQVHDPAEVKKPGTGLGLYISRGVVAAHGGTITAASRGRGQGTTFTVELPVRPPEAPPDADAQLPAPAPNGTGAREEAVRTPPAPGTRRGP